MPHLLRVGLRSSLLPVAAVAIALVAGAVLMTLQGSDALAAYRGLLGGSLGSLRSLGQTLEKATPLVFTGLAVAVAFKAGLFNIGAQGQLLLGAVFGAGVGYAIGLPAVLHVPLALALGGIMGGLLAAGVGLLKVTTGAHEVITTIMLNFVVANFTDWLSGGPWREAGQPISRTPAIRETARIPYLADVPLGFVIAVAVAAVVWFVVRRTVVGFELSTVGANRHAGRYAGMPVNGIVVGAMAASGLLAGLGGAIESLGVVGRFEPGFNANLGFDGITIALLGRTNPAGIVPAALLVGAMRAGGRQMQFDAGVAPEVVDVILALMLFLVAAPMIIRWLLRQRAERGGDLQLSSGWGG